LGAGAAVKLGIKAALGTAKAANLSLKAMKAI